MLKGGLVVVVVAGQGAGVGEGALFHPFFPPHLIDDNGLTLSDLLGDIEELARLFQSFDIESDYLGIFILAEIAHHLVEVEVTAVAQSYRLAYAHVLVGQSVHGVYGSAAALRRHAHVARLAQGKRVLERGVEFGRGIDEAQRVGPDNLDSRPVGDGFKL
ncbi:MAG: hypothetical protein PVJ08_00975 [Dehalococcoidia bacterium]